MLLVSKLLQVDQEISRTRRAVVKERPQPALPAPEPQEAIEPQIEPADIAAPAPTTPPPQALPAPLAAPESPRDAAPPSRRFRWTNGVVALAIVAGVSAAAFDVWRRTQASEARAVAPPAPPPPAVSEALPVAPPAPDASQPVSEAANEPATTEEGTARQDAATVLQLIERALRDAARALSAAEGRPRDR